jgi:proteasome activator subunit 4
VHTFLKYELEFCKNHHWSWGKLYKPEDVKLSWHVPDLAEIDFALQLFRELVEPTLSLLEGLLEDGEQPGTVYV